MLCLCFANWFLDCEMAEQQVLPQTNILPSGERPVGISLSAASDGEIRLYLVPEIINVASLKAAAADHRKLPAEPVDPGVMCRAPTRRPFHPPCAADCLCCSDPVLSPQH